MLLLDPKEWLEKNRNKKITITLSYEEWYDICSEAEGHLAYWCEENEAVDKLSEILENFKNKNEWFEQF